MTPEELRSLIQSGESLEVEFKRDDVSDNDLIEEIVCIANGPGGWILLGVEDDGAISGLKHDFDPGQFLALVQGRTQPPLAIRARVVELDGQRVAAIHIPKQRHVVATSSGKYLQRAPTLHGPECRPLYPHEISSRLSVGGNYDFSAQPVPSATWDDLDPLEFDRLRQTISLNPGADQILLDDSNEQIVRALRLTAEFDGQIVPTVAGLLLLGRQDTIQRLLPAHEAAFQVTGPDLNMRVNEFTRAPLIKLFERFGELFSAHNPQEELRSGMFRVDVPRFPPEAFREALANALVHRDYAALNAVYVQIQEGSDELTIINPGGFPEGVTPDNVLAVGPRPRNPALADAFKRIGIVERRGRGIERIFREALKSGKRPPNYGGSTNTLVRVTFHGGPADVALLKVLHDVQKRTGRLLDLPHLLLLWLIRERGEVTLGEALDSLRMDPALSRRVLEELLDLGLIEAKGQGRGRKYFLSMGVATALGKKTAYTRRSGIARARQEAIVLEHAKKHGKITRKDVLLLFPELSERQATGLLEAMVRKGNLRAMGRKGGKHYILP